MTQPSPSSTSSPAESGAVERVARIIEPKAWADEDWRRELVAKRALIDTPTSIIVLALEPSLSAAEAILTTLNVGELVTALEQARETLRLITKERRVIGPLSTRALNDCHAINAALLRFRGASS